jgi:SAM-dependent methyltransferase
MLTDAERIIGLYQRHARAWAAAREDLFGGPLIEVGWLDRFLRMLPPCPAVLDLGCGSGEPIGRYLAEKGCHLTGVDAALEMITMWKGRLPQHAWHVADMRSLSLGRLFDGVLAWDSFFHFSHDDQRRMFPVFRAHAGSGAPPNVHKRSLAWRGYGHIWRRAAVPCESGCRRVPLPTRRARLRHRGP